MLPNQFDLFADGKRGYLLEHEEVIGVVNGEQGDCEGAQDTPLMKSFFWRFYFTGVSWVYAYVVDDCPCIGIAGKTEDEVMGVVKALVYASQHSLQ